jgi:hypothetical protein
MSGSFENFNYEVKSGSNKDSIEYANPLEMPEEMGVEMTKEQKEIYASTKDIIKILDFPMSSSETKSISIKLKDILDKKGHKVSNNEFALMFAAALLLVAGSRELVPQNIDKDCVSFKYADVSYLVCVLKKIKKYNIEDLEKKLMKSYLFLSKEMKVPIAKDIEIKKRKARASLSKSPEVPSEGMSRVQRSAFVMKKGFPGISQYILLPKIKGEDPTARKRTKVQNDVVAISRNVVEKKVVSEFKKQIEKQMKDSEHKEVYKFIKDNVDKDMDEIETLLRQMKLKGAPEIKKNIKIAKKSIEDEINERLANIKL